MKKYHVKIITCWFGIWREKEKIISEIELAEICFPGVRVDILEIIPA